MTPGGEQPSLGLQSSSGGVGVPLTYSNTGERFAGDHSSASIGAEAGPQMKIQELGEPRNEIKVLANNSLNHENYQSYLPHNYAYQTSGQIGHHEFFTRHVP